MWSQLYDIQHDKFLSCSNTKCGIIYKDVLDETVLNGDIMVQRIIICLTLLRCGMPINPLLKESSYGCTVVCHPRSSYEMRKIRRYTEWQSMPYKEKGTIR